MFLKMHEKSLWFTIHPYIWQQSCIGKNLVETEMFKCNFICSQVQWKKSSLQSLLQFTSLPFSREEAPLWQHSLGDVSITLPLPICKCFAIKQRLHSACSKRRWVIHFYPLFNGKNCATDIKNSWVRLRMACGEEWIDEWANRERKRKRETDWLCDERAQFDCFCESEWKLQMLQAPSP